MNLPTRGRASSARREDAPPTEAHVRETLAFLGFEEVEPGYYVRLDGPHGRARSSEDARIFTTVRLTDVVGSAAAFERVVLRFSRVHGRLER